MGEKISIKEAAQRLGVAVRSIYGFIDVGDLPAWREGQRSVVVDADDVDALGSGDTGAAGVREPRDPAPRSGSSAAALPLPHE